MGFFMGRDKDSEDIKDINGSVSAASVFRDDQQTDQQTDQGTDQEADKDVNQFREDGFSDSADAADAAGEEQAEQRGTGEDDHYDGSTIRDVFGNYDKVRRGEGYYPIHFVETRKYLQQVRDQKRHIQLLENRIQYRRDAGLDTSWHEEELEKSRKQLTLTIAEDAEEISKLKDVNQEVVLTKRYIDLMTWDEVAETADLKMRTVQKCHGHALPCMQEILLSDGLIELAEDQDQPEKE